MEAHEIIKRCFVIGPMKDMNRLNTLAYQVIEPLLKPYQYKVITPDLGEIGAIMNQVLLNLEQADILIADITGNNPNVMYELGIYHSYGKPYIAVSEKPKKNSREKTPFDISAFRFVEIDLSDIEFSRKAIEPLLTRTIEKMDQLDWFENPVTVFYNSPVAEIPTAIGLFKNYSRNFLHQLHPGLFSKHEERDEYLFSVWVHEPSSEHADREGFVKLTNEDRALMKFEILIPDRLYMAEHDYIKALKDEHPDFPYVRARVFKKSRPFDLHVRKTNDGSYVLADFTTVLSTLNESIGVRRKMHEKKIEDNDWRILEIQELERFAKKCELFKDNLITQHPQARGRIEVVSKWKY